MSEIIVSLDHGKRFGKRLYIRIILRELVQANFMQTFCISLEINCLIVKWRDLSPLDVSHCWVELGEQRLVCLFLFPRFLFLVVCALHLVTILDLGLLLLLLMLLLEATLKLVTTSFYSVHLNLLM
jgi:hypothetical protein